MAGPSGSPAQSGPLLLPGPDQRTDTPLRASQTERDEAVSELRERFVAGQLSQDTFVQRVEMALTARDRGQLAALFADLRGARRLRMPGWRALAARVAFGSRASAVAAPVRHVLASSARWLNTPDARQAGPPIPADLPFPVSSQVRFTIGRSPECDLAIADITVSWQHACLDRAQQGWLLTDFGSTNGTRLNGWRVREPVPVSAGDQVSFGAATFVLRPSSGPGATP
jgi:FHA domain/Domain of unknown function (DUF1707)